MGTLTEDTLGSSLTCHGCVALGLLHLHKGTMVRAPQGCAVINDLTVQGSIVTPKFRSTWSCEWDLLWEWGLCRCNWLR